MMTTTPMKASTNASLVVEINPPQQHLPVKIDLPQQGVSKITELGMAEAVYERFSDSFHILHETGGWLVADPDTGLWRSDIGEEVVTGYFREYLQQGRKLIADLVMKGSPDTAKWITAIQKLERNLSVQGAKTLLKTLPGVTVNQSIFDTNPYVVGVKGGQCIDLRTGTARKILPSDHLTKTLGTTYEPEADCPLFKKSLLQWCCGNTKLVRFLQVWSGYCLSGLTEIQELLFLYGNGRNGKSVFTSVLSQLAGDYAQMMPSECLMAKDNAATNDVARLVGKRFVTAVELPEGKLMDENKVKQLIGGDRVSARPLYRDFFEFRPVLKLTISGNHKPVIRGTDDGIWRRMNLVPFNAQIASEDVDVDLTNKLYAEMPGILNWSLQGFQIYRAEGWNVPECVKMESQAYRAEMDTVGLWMAECTYVEEGAQTTASDLYTSFKRWAEKNGFSQMNSTTFGRKLGDRLESKRTASAKVYLNITLMEPLDNF